MKKTSQSPAMLLLRRVTRLLALVIIALVLVGFFMSSNYRVERDVLIHAPQEKVFGHLLSGEALPKWMHIQNGQIDSFSGYLGPGDDVDLVYLDSSDRGLLTVVELTDSSVLFNVRSKSAFDAVQNKIELQRVGENTKVIWVIEGELRSGLLSPYLALFANSIAGSNFELSLLNLKEQVESGI